MKIKKRPSFRTGKKDDRNRVTTFIYVNLAIYTSTSTIILRRCNRRTCKNLVSTLRVRGHVHSKTKTLLSPNEASL